MSKCIAAVLAAICLLASVVNADFLGSDPVVPLSACEEAAISAIGVSTLGDLLREAAVRCLANKKCPKGYKNLIPAYAASFEASQADYEAQLAECLAEIN